MTDRHNNVNEQARRLAKQIDGFFRLWSSHVMDLDGSGVKLYCLSQKDNPKHNAEAQHSTQTKKRQSLRHLNSANKTTNNLNLTQARDRGLPVLGIL